MSMVYKIIIGIQTFECTIQKHEVVDNIYSGTCKEPNNDDRHYFDYTFCWRGVWEGRIYFKDSEYWGEDIALINTIWTILENKLKEIIRYADPTIVQFE